jgi:hypothetical protein
MAYASVLGCWIIIYKRLQAGFCKKVLLSRNLKLLIMCERIGEELKIIQCAVHSLAPISVALKSVQHITVWG